MSLALLDTVLSSVVIGLLAFNWHWEHWTRRLRRAVPGSLQQERAKRACRMSRYPGFLFWPLIILDNVLTAVDPSTSLALRIFCAVFSLLFVFIMKRDWLEFRRQIEEDDDDPWNKGKRALKKLGAAAKQAATIRVPQPAALGA